MNTFRYGTEETKQIVPPYIFVIPIDEEDDLFSDDDEDFYNDKVDDDLGLDFDSFHIKHGNREIETSDENESSEDEEGLVFTRNAGFEQDANLHGTSYAKWKRKMLKEMGEEEDDYNDDINEVDEF